MILYEISLCYSDDPNSFFILFLQFFHSVFCHDPVANHISYFFILNVNWKVFGLIEEDSKKQTGKKLLNVGSFGLHVIHNSFRDGCFAVEWDVETLLASVRWRLKDSRCHEDYKCNRV